MYVHLHHHIPFKILNASIKSPLILLVSIHVVKLKNFNLSTYLGKRLIEDYEWKEDKKRFTWKSNAIVVRAFIRINAADILIVIFSSDEKAIDILRRYACMHAAGLRK
jgi:hypothetical protein